MNRTTASQSHLLRLRYAVFCLGKAFLARKKKAPAREVSDIIRGKKAFTVINDEGEETVCDILFSYDKDEDEGEIKHFIVYTDNSKDDEGNVKVYASIYTPQRGHGIDLLPIEAEEDWKLIEGILTDIQEKIRNGEPLDDFIEDEETDDEVLESIPLIVWYKLYDWTYRCHFPVSALLPYIVGVIVFHFVNYTQLPIWVETGFVLIELILMRISYDSIGDTHNTVAWCITFSLYVTLLVHPFELVLDRVIPKTTEIIPFQLHMRGSIIIAMVFIILRMRWEKWNKRKTRKAKK